MNNDEKRVTEMAESICFKEPITMTHEDWVIKLLAFEHECIKRAGLEVLALREALEDAEEIIRRDEMIMLEHDRRAEAAHAEERRAIAKGDKS